MLCRSAALNSDLGGNGGIISGIASSSGRRTMKWKSIGNPLEIRSSHEWHSSLVCFAWIVWDNCPIVGTKQRFLHEQMSKEKRSSRNPMMGTCPGFFGRKYVDHRPLPEKASHLGSVFANHLVPQLYGGFHEWGVPKNGWFIMELPIKIRMIWGYPYFRKPTYLVIGYRYPQFWAKKHQLHHRIAACIAAARWRTRSLTKPLAGLWARACWLTYGKKPDPQGPNVTSKLGISNQFKKSRPWNIWRKNGQVNAILSESPRTHCCERFAVRFEKTGGWGSATQYLDEHCCERPGFRS